MESTGKKKRIQKTCTLWTHDKSFSDQDVVFNLSKFSELNFQNGYLAKVVPLDHGGGVAVGDFPHSLNNSALKRDVESSSDVPKSGPSARKRRRNSVTITIDETGNLVHDGKPIDCRRAYVFVVRDASTELKVKHPSLCISISATIAAAFGFRNRMQVAVVTADESHWASHVEISFRDEYLAGSDMWRMVASELANRTVYKDQKLLFMGTIRATVKQVYRDGERRKSAYFARNTKPIFRSQSARFVLLIQMSKEMWDFDVEGSGEIMFNKVINGFVPELFKKWSATHARHLVSIVLFTRIEYKHGVLVQMERSTGESQDFYRVVVNDIASGDWINILYQLKKEFRTFLRDVTINRTAPGKPEDTLPESIIAGMPSSAARGNILEAINLASAQYSRDYIDRDLVRTGISIVVITAGTGVFEVDYSVLKLTTDALIGSGIGLDLVSLSPMPLHSVPLFRYREPSITSSSLPTSLSQSFMSADAVVAPMSGVSGMDDGWRYAMPHWVDISFWTGSNDESIYQAATAPTNKSDPGTKRLKEVSFNLRCRLYELQMMGIMENDMSNISLELMHQDQHHPWHQLKHEITSLPVANVDRRYLNKLDKAWMDQYDEHVFVPEVDGESNKHGIMEKAGRNDAARIAEPSGGHKRPDLVPNRSNFLEWSFKSNSAARPFAARRMASSSNIVSDADSFTSRPGQLSRQISFGGGRFGAAKAVASTELTIELPSVNAPTFSKRQGSNPTAESIQASDFSNKIKASLNKPVERPDTSSSTSLKETDGRSLPIAIGRIKPDECHRPEAASSQDTIRELGSPSKADVPLEPIDSRDSGAILYAASASQRIGREPGISASGEAPPVPKTLSPTSALAPWLVLVNPSNPQKNNFNLTSQFRRWQHVFPKPLHTSTMKWKSLCSPACIPLTTEYFPTASQLADEYQESPYNISPDTDDTNLLPEKVRETLIRELISSRLTHGFQFVVGATAAEFLGIPVDEMSTVFEKGYMSQDGNSVLMSVGNTIHQISCAAGNEIEIRRFNRKSPAGMESTAGKPFSLSYKPHVRIPFAKCYEVANITLRPPRLNYNWNFIDQFLAGYRSDFSDAIRFWRARFVLIPINMPRNKAALSVHVEDQAEELRLEGIYKLTQIWQRNRVFDEEQRLNLRIRKTKDANPLAIEYQTKDPSAVVSAIEKFSLQVLMDPDAAPFPTQLFDEKEPYETSNIDLHELARDLQGDKGIKIIDRTWHWRKHTFCFVGFDLTSWLLHHFRDVSSREEAVELGNQLMGKNFFHHVHKKHRFRDGQYFYQLTSEYQERDKDRPSSSASWFRATRSDRLGTPMVEAPRTPLSGDRPISRPSTGSSASSGAKTPTKESEGKRKIHLSRVLKYDLDPRRRSYRPEVINLHYDRLHNPENCYHIRIDWMNVTAKLVEDAIVTWAKIVERHGLRLVEVPISETSTIGDLTPFRAPYVVKLAVLPPPIPNPSYYVDNITFTSHSESDRFPYHKALLRRFEFVLDMEAASCFPSDIDVSYSWGRPDYRYTQYIHKTGVLLVQIRDNGDFLLLANRLYTNHTATARENGKYDKSDAHDTPPSRRYANQPAHTLIKDRGSGRRSPFASPLLRASATAGSVRQDLRHSIDHHPNNAPSIGCRTAEDLRIEFEAHCGDAAWLQRFYAEALKLRVVHSPTLPPVSDDRIPNLRLPPCISTRALSQSPILSGRNGREGAASTLGVGFSSGGESDSASPKNDDGLEK